MVRLEDSLDIINYGSRGRGRQIADARENSGEVKKRVWGENDAVHLAINVITPFGHVLTHRPQPKHRSELYTSELLFISLAPN